MAEAAPKIAWKRAELAVNRFVKTAETDLARLKQFKKNIVEFENDGDRTSVKTELKRAQQTIAQLQENLESVQKIRSQVKDEDITKFDSKLTQVRMWIMEDINKFAQLDADFLEYMGEEFAQLLKTGLDAPNKDISFGNQVEDTSSLQLQTQSQLDSEMATQLSASLAVTRDQEEKVMQLGEDVDHAHDIMKTLHSMIHGQGEAVSQIEDNIETAHTNVKEGGGSLNKAVAFKLASFTMIGAVGGALLGGPVGLAMGAKMGMLAAGTGAAVGATVGKTIKNAALEANETELQNLNSASDMAETKSLRKEKAEPGKANDD